MPHELRLEEIELERERLRAREELGPHLVERLDKAFQTRPGSSTPFDADEAYFSKFTARVRVHREARERDKAHLELPETIKAWFERALPGTIPGGATLYFQEFAERLWARIRGTSAPQEVPEWLELALKELIISAEQDKAAGQEYFDAFLNRLRMRIETGEVMPVWLGEALQASRWEMPVDEKSYFESFSRRLHARTHPEQEQEETAVPEWLSERLSSATFGAGDRPPVALSPVGASTRGPRPRMHVLYSSAGQWAVAAAICLLLGLGVLIKYQVPPDEVLGPRSYEEVVTMQRTLSGGNFFVETIPDGDGLAAGNERSPEAQMLSGELGDASNEELEFILNNIRTY